ncbi:hypothetical protein BIW11_04197 [Tropilaelaps mercedesae]|uniref:Uncharacterized protein n=1 Tax=Tropilaelaps mercedesae TaxID=418985 RepID=A0A1V9X9Z7_9ACAR|nr:hypothetical protein BIW11_04197 [Tropilaelaps mercedesae]
MLRAPPAKSGQEETANVWRSLAASLDLAGSSVEAGRGRFIPCVAVTGHKQVQAFQCFPSASDPPSRRLSIEFRGSPFPPLLIGLLGRGWRKPVEPLSCGKLSCACTFQRVFVRPCEIEPTRRSGDCSVLLLFSFMAC